jgi:hypothetical protein
MGKPKRKSPEAMKGKRKIFVKKQSPSATTYQIKVELEGIKPPIWRRFLVHSDLNLRMLHAIIQIAFGWQNSHLHQFMIAGEFYSDARMNEDRFLDEKPVLDEWTTHISVAFTLARDRIMYEYDFGDSWIHIVEFEKKVEGEMDVALAKCVEGARAAPPDGCGGPYGYEELRKALFDPKHEEHDSMVEWLGRPFDPEKCDVEEISRYLRRLKSSKISDGQPAKILMDRDGNN